MNPYTDRKATPKVRKCIQLIMAILSHKQTNKQTNKMELPVMPAENLGQGFTQSVIKRDTQHTVTIASLKRIRPKVFIREAKKDYKYETNGPKFNAPRYSDEINYQIY